MMIILFPFAMQVNAQNVIDQLLDKLFDRALHDRFHTELDNTTVNKAGNLALPTAQQPQLTALRPKISGHVQPTPSFGTFPVPSFQRPVYVPHGTTNAGSEVQVRSTVHAPNQQLDQAQSMPLQRDTPGALISEASLLLMEKEELLNGQAVKALRRFSDAMERLPNVGWESRMKAAFREMALNLESFNPVFTACLLQVQMTAGISNYERRDQCLQRLIQPLAGEYGLHAGEPLGKTHRALFREWYESVMGGDQTLQALLEDSKCSAPKAEWLFKRMMADIETAGGQATIGDKMEKACYALGYNLAVEYLANPEKTWLLESFTKFDDQVLKPLGRKAEYEFLVVHAIGEKEHANLGHEATTLFVPQSFEGTVRLAMRDHDRDLAAYYNTLADILEGLAPSQCQPLQAS